MKNIQYIRRIRQAHRNQAQYKKGFVVPLLVAVIAVLIIAGGAYLAYKNEKGQTEQAEQTNNQFLASTTLNTNVGTSGIQASSSVNTSTNIQSTISSQSNPSINVTANILPASTYGQNHFSIEATYDKNILTPSQVSIKFTCSVGINAEVPSAKFGNKVLCPLGTDNMYQSVTDGNYYEDIVFTNSNSSNQNMPVTVILYGSNGNILAQGQTSVTLAPNQTSNQSTSSTAWKTYTNSQYGFSIEYPQDWVVSSKPFSVVDGLNISKTFTGSQGYTCNSAISLISTSVFDQNAYFFNSAAISGWQVTTPTINNHSIVAWINSTHFPGTYYYFVKNANGQYSYGINNSTKTLGVFNRNTMIWTTMSQYIYVKECADTFSQMLSTFKFTN
jgi:hypothetical protein